MDQTFTKLSLVSGMGIGPGMKRLGQKSTSMVFSVLGIHLQGKLTEENSWCHLQKMAKVQLCASDFDVTVEQLLLSLLTHLSQQDFPEQKESLDL